MTISEKDLDAIARGAWNEIDWLQSHDDLEGAAQQLAAELRSSRAAAADQALGEQEAHGAPTFDVRAIAAVVENAIDDGHVALNLVDCAQVAQSVVDHLLAPPQPAIESRYSAEQRPLGNPRLAAARRALERAAYALRVGDNGHSRAAHEAAAVAYVRALEAEARLVPCARRGA